MDEYDDGIPQTDGTNGTTRPFVGPRAPRPKLSKGASDVQPSRWHLPEIDPVTGIFGYFAAALSWLQQSYIQEISEGNQFSWFVVAYAAGAAGYLILPQEPSFLALSTLLLALAGSWLVRRRSAPHVFALTFLLMLVAGVWTGSLKSLLMATPRLDHERTVVVTGWVLDEETVLNGATRRTIKVASMTARGLDPAHTPRLIAVTFRASAPPVPVGSPIRFTARIRPPQGPIMPGGYDFARHAFFHGFGASGYALGKIGRATLDSPALPERLAAGIADLRHTISARLRAALPGAEGAIAAAIIVGETRGIPDAENDALRMSGLPHMITIAGLHMSIVAGCVFFSVRWLLALFPAIALRFPIKTWAAAGALVATTFYLLISGNHLSAERAYLMGAIMLLAIMFGRPALTMRNLGLSAIILIAYNPAEVVEPGFLMSFLAVMALIATYQTWWRWRTTGPTRPDRRADGLVRQTFGSLIRHCLGAAASAVIATAATAAVTADQFYRVPPYGALTNLIVLPAIDLVAMPAAVLACLMMPFGLEVIPLTVMGYAIQFMDLIGTIAAGLPGGQGLIGRIHPWTVALAITGLCWLCLWQRSWRLLGAAPLALALFVAPFANRPDVLISPDAGAVAVRASDGQMKVLGARQNRFIVANWLTADAAPNAPADPRVALDPTIADGWTCDPSGCVFRLQAQPDKRKRVIAVAMTQTAFDEDCLMADVVISRLVAPSTCKDTAAVFDRDSLTATGAVALQFETDRTITHASTDGTQQRFSDFGAEDQKSSRLRFKTETALQLHGRPWMSAPLDRSPLPHDRAALDRRVGPSASADANSTSDPARTVPKLTEPASERPWIPDPTSVENADMTAPQDDMEPQRMLGPVPKGVSPQLHTSTPAPQHLVLPLDPTDMPELPE